MGRRNKLFLRAQFPSRSFWRSVSALCELPETGATIFSDQKYALEEGGYARVFAISARPLTKEEKELDELEDLPL